MDIIRFRNPTSPTKMEQAEIINGLSTKMWVERYISNGEFTLTGPLDAGLKDKLPIGSFVSHLNSDEIMVVENHEINDTRGSDSQIKITGRSLETIFEIRIVGENDIGINDPPGREPWQYSIVAAYTWDQAGLMIRDHIDTAYVHDQNDALPYFKTYTDATGVGVSIARIVARMPLYDALMELLKIDNLGIKCVRPGATNPFGPTDPNVAIVIHKGVDKSGEVMFSYDTGEIINANYLWSNRNLRNVALVTGKFLEVLVDPYSSSQLNRRVLSVDGSDLEGGLTAPPYGTYRDPYVAAFTQRGIEALAAQNAIALSNVDVSRDSVKSQYRKDYGIGDLVTVLGDYNQFGVQRVSEYVEMEDENGESSYPTLTVV